MHVIAYTSESLIPSNELEKSLSDIEKSAQARNKEKQITGALFYLNNRFLQIIEGDQGDLEELMEVLHKDPRHKDITYLHNNPAERRSLAEWDMEIFNLETDKKQSLRTLQTITDAFQQNLFNKENSNGTAAMLSDFYKSILK